MVASIVSVSQANRHLQYKIDDLEKQLQSAKALNVRAHCCVYLPPCAFSMCFHVAQEHSSSEINALTQRVASLEAESRTSDRSAVALSD